jgi:DNA-binding MarR family transcriptional regulator
MSNSRTARDEKGGTMQTDDSPDMLDAKLWKNPCPFTFRINYLALLYNTPLYNWVHETYGLKRTEYVAIYSLALADGGSARDISRTSGFPKNTLSRVINRLEVMGLIEARDKAPIGSRKQALHLSEKGWALFHASVSTFEAQEQRMLKSLSNGERQMLFELLSKVVVDAESWADSLPCETESEVINEAEGKIK